MDQQEAGGGGRVGASDVPSTPVPDSTGLRLFHSRGYVLIPIHRLGDTLADGRQATGKEPIGADWQRTRTSPDLAVCERWGNWGVLPGPSGLAVLDVEPAGLERWPLSAVPPDALVVLTPSGGYHLYLSLPAVEAILGPLRGKRRPQAPITGAELISHGGQVLGPGSRAYSAKAKREGLYVLHQAGQPLATRLDDILAPFRTPPRPAAIPIQPAPNLARADAWAHGALASELARVAAAPEGTRNDTLHLGAFRMGQLVGGALLDAASVLEQLVVAGCATGLDEREVRQTAWRGLEKGRESPRSLPDEPEVEIVIVSGEVVVRGAVPTGSALGPEAETGPRTIVTPGTHKLPDNRVIEVSHNNFAKTVLDVLPPGTFYRRDRVPGRVISGRFVPADVDDFRRICDPPNVRLVRWGSAKLAGGGTEQRMFFENCSQTNAALIRSSAADHLPNIDLLTTYPVVRADGTLSPPGYADGIYYDGPAVEPWTDPTLIREHLFDLVADFPFEDESSRANFLGLFLTPMLRPSVGKVPLHLVTSPTPGTGKSRLVEEVLGITYAGEPLTSSALPDRQEERAKWLTALLISGETLLHLDNLTDELDSGNLASLITSSRVSDRLLGSSTFLRLRNDLTIAATGNNTRLSSEIARRTVVIRLIWNGPGRPDERTEFKHQNLAQYVHERRHETISAIAGACMLADETAPSVTVGSFESWGARVWRALHAIGIRSHLANREVWRERTDAGEESLVGLLMSWADRWGELPVQASEVARHLQDQLASILERPSPVAVGRLLARHVDNSAGGFTIRKGWSRGSRSSAYWLERNASVIADKEDRFSEMGPTPGRASPSHLFGGLSPDDRDMKPTSPEGATIDITWT